MTRPNVPADLWERVAVGEPSECWPWLGSTVGQGYGQLSVGGRMMVAHRLAYELATGVPPGDLLVCHTCDNPPCCNPAHLFLGTTADNLHDAKIKGRVARGERCARARLTTAAVREMRARFAAGERKADLARSFGVTPTNVRFIVQRLTWRHV